MNLTKLFSISVFVLAATSRICRTGRRIFMKGVVAFQLQLVASHLTCTIRP